MKQMKIRTAIKAGKKKGKKVVCRKDGQPVRYGVPEKDGKPFYERFGYECEKI